MANVPQLLSLSKIWKQAPHNSMTDLFRYKDRWLCVFRESDSHMSGLDGEIRLITSVEGSEWESTSLWQEPGIDLRDPKLSLMPDGQLLLLAGGAHRNAQGRYILQDSRVAFSRDGKTWSPLQRVLPAGEWLWRLTWFDGVGYGAAYSYSDPLDRRAPWQVHLYATEDGLDYRLVTEWAIPGHPNETTLRFFPTGEAVALVRREAPGDDHAWIGFSRPPYTHWEWNDIGFHLGGPNFLISPEGILWAAGRIHPRADDPDFAETALCRFVGKRCELQLVLPSGGDTSYPGMVALDDQLWMSYYSSHEDSSAIYLAHIQLPQT